MPDYYIYLRFPDGKAVRTFGGRHPSAAEALRHRIVEVLRDGRDTGEDDEALREEYLSYCRQIGVPSEIWAEPM